MTTIAERLQDRPNLKKEDVEKMYVGENKRSSILDKEKAQIRYLAFDDALVLGQNAEGHHEYRAHWPITMATKPEAEILTGLAHIRLIDKSKTQQNSQAYVEFIEKARYPNSSNCEALLHAALANKDENGKARNPFMLIRALHEGKVVASARLYPLIDEERIFDQSTGEEKSIYKPAGSELTVPSIWADMSMAKTIDCDNRDKIRALVVGLTGEIPKERKVESGQYKIFDTKDQKKYESLSNLLNGVQSGEIKVEIMSGIKINFGADTRKAMLAKAGQRQYNYMVNDEQHPEYVPRAGFAATVIATLRHPDGEPYAIFVSPANTFPNAQPLNEIADIDAYLEKSMGTAAEKEIHFKLDKPILDTTQHQEEDDEKYGPFDLDDNVPF